MIEVKIYKTLKSSSGDFVLETDLIINDGDFLTLYGPSGAGKTSLLRVIAGLTNVDSGSILANGEKWLDTNTKTNLRPNHRSAGLVFQDYALFPNLTIKENITFGLKRNQDSALVKELVDLMDLGDLLERKPETLSGGQKQRVALARSIVTKPKILMLDEPLAALDLTMRYRLQDYLLTAHNKYELTTVLVSHDVGEIFKLSNRVIKLEHGKVIMDSTPADIFFNKEASGRFQFVGEVLEMSKEDVIYVITVLIGNQVVKVVAEESTAHEITVGTKVMVTSKAFNPIIQKIQ